MSEDEEFEFRLRLEKEIAPKAFNPDPKQGFTDALKTELENAGWAGRNLAGAGTAVSNLWEGAKQLVGQGDPERIQANRTISDSAPVGSIAGNIATYAPLAMIPGANTLLGGAAMGAATGAAQPILDGESRLSNTAIGGVTGAVIPAIIKAGKVIKAAVIDPFTTAGQNRIAGSLLNRTAADPKAVMQNLQGATGATPGFTPTVGQAANDAGVASLERTMRAINPAGFDAVDKSQRGALVDALKNIAQTPEARASAMQARKQAAAPLYAQVSKSDALADPSKVVNLIDRMIAANPANKALVAPISQIRESLFEQYPLTQRGSDAWKVLDNVLGKRMSSYDFDAVQSARTVMDRVRKGSIDDSEALNQLSSFGAKSKVASDVLDMAKQYIQTPGNVLMQKPYQLKSAMDNIKSMLGNQDNAFVKRELMTIKNSLGHQISKVEPAYKQAEQTFANFSKPINQMDIGQELFNRFTPALADQGGLPFKSTAQAYANALRNGDALSKNVTGMKNAKLESIMSPEQMQALTGVAKDSSVKAAAENAGRGVGSDTVQKISMSNIAAEAGIPNWMSSIAVVPGGWAKRAGDVVYGGSDKAIREQLANLLINPQDAAKAMNAAGANPSALAKLLKNGAQGLGLSVIPTLLNQ